MRDKLKPGRYGKILSVFFLVTVLFLEGNFLFSKGSKFVSSIGVSFPARYNYNAVYSTGDGQSLYEDDMLENTTGSKGKWSFNAGLFYYFHPGGSKTWRAHTWGISLNVVTLGSNIDFLDSASDSSTAPGEWRYGGKVNTVSISLKAEKKGCFGKSNSVNFSVGPVLLIHSIDLEGSFSDSSGGTVYNFQSEENLKKHDLALEIHLDYELKLNADITAFAGITKFFFTKISGGWDGAGEVNHSWEIKMNRIIAAAGFRFYF